MKNRQWLNGSAAALLMLGAGGVLAQADYPNKPIRFIVPIAAGSVTDVILRAAAPQLTQRIGQQVVVDNRPGASGIIGAQACAAAPRDGYTICAIYHATMSFNPLTHDKIGYDPQRDFIPVTNLYFVTEALAVPRSLPANSIAELRALAASTPKGLSFGTLGDGSVQELKVAWLNREWKVVLTGVPFKGGGPIATALVSNEIQIGKMGIGNFIGPLQAGQLKALAVSSTLRLAQFPQVPTLTEAGLAGLNSRVWWGVAVPAGTPMPIVDRLNAEFGQVFRDPKFVEFMDARHVEPATGPRAEFEAFLKEDRERAERLVKLSRQGASGR